MTTTTARWAWLIPAVLAAIATVVAASHGDALAAAVWTMWTAGSTWLSGFATAAAPTPSTFDRGPRR